MISAVLLRGVMRCGRCKVLTEIKLKRKKSQAGASNMELRQLIRSPATSSLWSDMQNYIPVHLIFTQNVKQNMTFSFCMIFHIQNKTK